MKISTAVRPLALMPLFAILAFTTTSAAYSASRSEAAGPDAEPAVPLYNDLGDHHHAITTSVPKTQQYFDQGLRLVYAFNHAEAIRAFEEGARFDPHCAMCYWGVALAHGPNINVPMDRESGKKAYAAVQKAIALADGVSEPISAPWKGVTQLSRPISEQNWMQPTRKRWAR